MPAKKKTVAKKAAQKKASKSVASYKYKATRANNPEVGLVSGDSDRVEKSAHWGDDPHLAPELRFDSDYDERTLYPRQVFFPMAAICI